MKLYIGVCFVTFLNIISNVFGSDELTIADVYANRSLVAYYGNFAHGCIAISESESEQNRTITSFGNPGDKMKFLCPYQDSGVVVIYGQGELYNIFIFNRKTDTEYTSGVAVKLEKTCAEILSASHSSVTATMDPTSKYLLVILGNSRIFVTCRRNPKYNTSLQLVSINPSDDRNLTFSNGGYLLLADTTSISCNIFNPLIFPVLQKLKTLEVIEGGIIDSIVSQPNGELLVTVLSHDDNSTIILKLPDLVQRILNKN